MAEHEYQVAVKAEYALEVDTELRGPTGSSTIPARSVDVANARSASPRVTHYALTEAEAAALRNDPRIIGVEIPQYTKDALPEEERVGDFAGEIFTTYNYGEQTFDKTPNEATDLNWGFARHSSRADPWQGGSGDYSKVLASSADGTGVDIVIMDDGTSPHPDYNDSQGTTRRQEINWYAAAGVAGTMPGNFYGHTSGHGAHVMGTTGGLYSGWAKNARLYDFKTLDSGSIGPSNGAFDLIRLWHLAKPIEPSTGYRRPTVVNMSWGYGYNGVPSSIANINYRGEDKGTQTLSGNNFGLVGRFSRVAIQNAVYDAEVEDMIAAGIHVCIAAGNTRQYLDVPAGPDFNNYFQTSNGGTKYYYAKNSPGTTNATDIKVGNLYNLTGQGGSVANEEVKSESSECGPMCVIWAAGSSILSCSFPGALIGNSYTYPFQGNTNSQYGYTAISGTSMATPQVTGVVACYLSQNPGATPAQVKQWLIDNGTDDLLYYTNDTDYRNAYQTGNANAKILFNPLMGLGKDLGTINGVPITFKAGMKFVNGLNIRFG